MSDEQRCPNCGGVLPYFLERWRTDPRCLGCGLPKSLWSKWRVIQEEIDWLRAEIETERAKRSPSEAAREFTEETGGES